MGKTKSKVKKKKRRLLVKAIGNGTANLPKLDRDDFMSGNINSHKGSIKARCPDCGCLKIKCRSIWKEQRKCCPDCRC